MKSRIFRQVEKLKDAIHKAYQSGKDFRKNNKLIGDPSEGRYGVSEAFKLGWNHQEQLARLLYEAETEFKNNAAIEAQNKIIADKIDYTGGK